ncbi:MAG: hypothetical protein AAF628_36370 [Planctomycetota bacterium]
MRTPDSMPTEESLQLLEELELNEPSEIARVRVRDAVKVRAEIRIRQGNASLRAEPEIEGRTREVSREQLLATADEPLSVADVYRVAFDRQVVALPDSYLLCTACRLLNDGRFEVELRFFTPVDVSQMAHGEEPS